MNEVKNMKHRLFLILIVVLLLTGCAVSTDKDVTYKQITMSEAKEMMASESDYIILDVRRPDEFAAGHIPNAINIPNESIGTDEISELPDKDQLILVYCRSGNRSKQASQKLVKLGYSNVVEFGGINDWKGEIEK
jgi:rhodanese-related sulfurtransferase